jgi:hypothetical protein
MRYINKRCLKSVQTVEQCNSLEDAEDRLQSYKGQDVWISQTHTRNWNTRVGRNILNYNKKDKR